MYSEILYPTDGSEGATVALDNSRDLAETYDARVHVLYVVDTTHGGLGMAGDPQERSGTGMAGTPGGAKRGMGGNREQVEEIQERRKNRGEAIVEEAAEKLGDVETKAVVESGAPHQTILEYTEDNDIDIIVMSTHGRRGLDRYLLGSVTEKVVRLSDVPVLTVRRDDKS